MPETTETLDICEKCNQVHTRCSGHKNRKNTNGIWQPCMKWKAKGRKGCRFHQDGVNVGAKNGNFKHGRFSKYAPMGVDNLLLELDESRREGEHFSLREQINLAEVRIAQLVSKLDTSSSSKTWLDIRQARLDIMNAVKSGNADQLTAALKVLESVSEAGQKEHRAWEELFKVQRQLKLLIESERKKMVEDKFMVTLDEFVIVLSMIGHAINQKVTDPEIRRELGKEVRMISQKAGFEIV